MVFLLYNIRADTSRNSVNKIKNKRGEKKKKRRVCFLTTELSHRMLKVNRFVKEIRAVGPTGKISGIWALAPPANLCHFLPRSLSSGLFFSNTKATLEEGRGNIQEGFKDCQEIQL